MNRKVLRCVGWKTLQNHTQTTAELTIFYSVRFSRKHFEINPLFFFHHCHPTLHSKNGLGTFGGYLQAGNFWVIFVFSPNVSGENFLGKNGGPNLGPTFPLPIQSWDPRSSLNKFTVEDMYLVPPASNSGIRKGKPPTKASLATC